MSCIQLALIFLYSKDKVRFDAENVESFQGSSGISPDDTNSHVELFELKIGKLFT